jgi:hypothetical protein
MINELLKHINHGKLYGIKKRISEKYPIEMIMKKYQNHEEEKEDLPEILKKFNLPLEIINHFPKLTNDFESFKHKSIRQIVKYMIISLDRTDKNEKREHLTKLSLCEYIQYQLDQQLCTVNLRDEINDSLGNLLKNSSFQNNIFWNKIYIDLKNKVYFIDIPMTKFNTSKIKNILRGDLSLNKVEWKYLQINLFMNHDTICKTGSKNFFKKLNLCKKLTEIIPIDHELESDLNIQASLRKDILIILSSKLFEEMRARNIDLNEIPIIEKYFILDPDYSLMMLAKCFSSNRISLSQFHSLFSFRLKAVPSLKTSLFL